MSLSGRVVQVESIRRGAVALDWTGKTMLVQNAADLPHDGGTVVDDDGIEIPYTAVEDGPDIEDPDTVYTTDAAPDGWVPSWEDEDGNTVTDERPVYVTPEQVDVIATVDTGDGLMLPCVVPHALRPLLVDGIREEDDREPVQCIRSAGVWTIDDVLGREGVIEGTRVVTPSRNSLPRVQMHDSVIEVVRDDGEGDPVVTTSLGGEDEDHLQIYDTNGELKAGIDPDGVITGSSVQVANDIMVSGTSLLQMIADRPQGIIAAHRFLARTPDVGTTETATVDLAFTAKPGRLYRFRVDGNFRASDSVRPMLRFRVSQGGDDGSAAAQPTVSSPQIGLSTVVGPTAGLIGARGSMEYTLITPATDPVRQIRVLLTIQGNSTSGSVFVYDSTEFTVSDEGALYSGTFNDGNSGAPIVQTWTKTYPLSWVYLWRNGSGQPGVTTPQQGYATRALGVGHPAGQWYTMVGWPTQMQTDLTGAQSISSIEFYCNCYDTMNASGFVPRVYFHHDTGVPASGNPYGDAGYLSNPVPRGAVNWLSIRSDRYSSIANSTFKGLSFGIQAGQDPQYAGCFSMVDPSGASFRATYTK